MKTKEQAIEDIENDVTWEYKKPYPDSEFRNNLEESTEYLIAQLRICLGKVKEDKKQKATQEIINLVAPGCTNKCIITFEDTHRFENILKNCIIIQHHIESSKSINGEITIDDLNAKYSNKFLIFNGDEAGTEIVYVKNIHRPIDDNSSFQVDGIMIDLCTCNHKPGDGVLVYKIEDWDFSDFWYFDEGYETPKELDEALMSNPTDTEYETHIISESEVISNILNSVRWALELKGSKTMAGVFKDLSEKYEDKSEEEVK